MRRVSDDESLGKSQKTIVNSLNASRRSSINMSQNKNASLSLLALPPSA